ncbi:hypothetical protein K7574_21005 (plasmid) [Stenotrophomonas maltophilia]|uniref:hypothetical protein n=1 Tax=Stenotrophomonas maltophilia TaxID=40324 RepID=UPI001D0C7A15|nr:hypothetical protein [Stenotrophomonas maltophilia]UXF74689.1 hypothetical protein K7574_21005 [Stenotrophomonas maltophilia]
MIELEFTELPDTPGRLGGKLIERATTGNGFLLSMWNATSRIAVWRDDVQRFEDTGGLLNPAAIRAWAPLPQPVDLPAWAEAVVGRALERDQTVADAGWLQPIHAEASTTI